MGMIVLAVAEALNHRIGIVDAVGRGRPVPAVGWIMAKSTNLGFVVEHYIQDVGFSLAVIRAGRQHPVVMAVSPRVLGVLDSVIEIQRKSPAVHVLGVFGCGKPVLHHPVFAFETAKIKCAVVHFLAGIRGDRLHESLSVFVESRHGCSNGLGVERAQLGNTLSS